MLYSYFMHVCSIVKSITGRCGGRPDALLHKAIGQCNALLHEAIGRVQ